MHWSQLTDACGLTRAAPARAQDATALGVGQFVRRAPEAGVQDIAIGLGDSASTDGELSLLTTLVAA